MYTAMEQYAVDSGFFSSTITYILTQNFKKGVVTLMIDVLRKNCTANQNEVFPLKAPSVAFQVKNLTSGHVFACMGNRWVEAESVCVPSMSAEVIVSNADPNCNMVHATETTVTIRPTEDGLVEVMRID